MPDKPKKIPFKIDRTNHEISSDQNPVTGEFLRSLEPAVPEDYDLWLRGRDHEDDIVVNPGDPITVRPGDHFFTAKRVSTEGDEPNE